MFYWIPGRAARQASDATRNFAGDAAEVRRRRLAEVLRLPPVTGDGEKGSIVKVWVDPERCQGHTLCAMIAPKVFQLDDVDGHSSPVSEVVAVDQEAKVAEAVRSCPEQAISTAS
jgi:ferredoxin